MKNTFIQQTGKNIFVGKYRRTWLLLIALVAYVGNASVGYAQTVTITSAKGTNNYKDSVASNYGACEGFGNDNANTFQQNSFVEFDLSAIPAGATITSATLRLVHAPDGTGWNNESGGQFISNIRSVTKPWVEGTVCNSSQPGSLTWASTGTTNWTTAGGDFAGSYGSIIGGASDDPGKVNTVLVTSLVQQWHAGTLANYGFGIVPATLVSDSNEAWYYWYSDDASTATNRPQLIITYTMPPVSGTVSKTNACIGTANASITVSSPTGGDGTYEYRINSDTWQSSGSFSSLTSGTYTVGIRDANNITNQTTLTTQTISNLLDTDGDNVSDACDLDDDNDGILDTAEGNVNIDSDGLVNFLDTDSDGDGCFDAIEGGDGNITAANVDVNGRITGGVNANGVPILADSGQVVGNSQLATQVVILSDPANQALAIGLGGASATFTVSARADDATAYSGGIPNYGAAGNSNTGLRYQWYLGDPDNGGTALTNTGFYSGNDSQTLTVSNILGLFGNDYYVVVTHISNECVLLKRSATLSLLCGAVTGSVISKTDIDCFGAATGTATIAGATGVAPYVYQLDGGALLSSGTFTNLTAGDYTVVVSEVSGCETTVNFTITEPDAALLVSAPTTVQPACFGAGSISLNAAGGTASYTYDWADLAGTNNVQNRLGLSSGTYSVTATDANGCTVSSDNVILEAPADCDPIDICQSSIAEVFSIDPDPANISYIWTVPAGAVVVSGQGTPEVAVNWTGVTPGSYQVCVVAVNDCGESAQTCTDINLVEVTGEATVMTPVCEDNNITLLATGGVSYSWTGPNSFTSSDPNPTILNADALTHSGLYTVSVTNAAGCDTTATVLVTVEDAPTFAIATAIGANCNQSDGAIDITISGGTPAYSFEWSNGATIEDLTNVSSGNYTVTVTDSKGCSQTSTIGVSNLTGPTVITTQTDITCNGANTGSIELTVIGVTGPYTYLWSNGDTTKDISGLAAGTYSVIVTDNIGCVGTATATITEPNAITLDNTQIDIACLGSSTGSIDLNVSGGSLPYTYSWTKDGSPLALGNLQDLTLLEAGTYVVEVTDSNGCTAAKTILITQSSAALSATSVISDIKCDSTSGQVVLNVTGGTAPYSYSWTGTNSFVVTTKDITNRPAGTYNVTITDAAGCTFTMANMVITQPTTLLTVAPVTIENVKCFGGASGSIDINAVGGTGPYTYIWNTGANTEDISGLNPGGYSVVVSDTNGCKVVSNVFLITDIVEPISATLTATEADCFGTATGEVSIISNGGIPTYTYLWSNGSTDQSLLGVTSGDYFVTVTDSNLCTRLFTTSVGQPLETVITANITNAPCTGSATGEITTSVTGGSSSYTYQWLDGSTDKDRTALVAGTYTLNVTDSSGCITTKAFIVKNTSNLSLTSITTPISCFGSTDGRVNLIVNGGVGPISFAWSANAGNATTEDISGLSAGTYSVTVSDTIGCVKTLTTILVIEPDSLITAASKTKSVACKGGSDGEATVTATGGTIPYTYNWSNGATTASATGLAAGTYNVSVTDANGCTATSSVIIDEPTTEIELFITTINASSCGDSTGSIDLTVQNGTAPFTYVWTGPTAIGNVEDPSNLAAGTYNVVVTDSSGCSKSISAITIISAQALTVTIESNAISCLGQDGEVFAVITGGVAPYTYLWAPGAQTTSSVTGLSAGTYTVTVTDANGCQISTSGTLTVPTNCQPPVAVDDEYKTNLNTPVSGTVATNDSDPDNLLSELVFQTNGPLSDLTAGTIIFNADGMFTFTPTTGFIGVVTQPYLVTDPQCNSDDAILTIVVSLNEDSTDISVVKLVNESAVELNDEVNFSIIVKNNGSIVATNVVVKDSLPVGLQYLSGAESVRDGQYFWKISSLLPGESKTLTINARVIMRGVSTNTVSIETLDQIDTDPTNDVSVVCVSVPIVLCQGESVELSVPDTFTNVQWYKDDVFFASGNTVLVTEGGSYTNKSAENSCSTNNCCPIVVVTQLCCPAEICTPIIIEKVR